MGHNKTPRYKEEGKEYDYDKNHNPEADPFTGIKNQFKAGNQASKGRRSKKELLYKLDEAVLNQVGPERFAALIEKVFEKAEKGNDYMLKLIAEPMLKRLLPSKEEIEINNKTIKVTLPLLGKKQVESEIIEEEEITLHSPTDEDLIENSGKDNN